MPTLNEDNSTNQFVLELRNLKLARGEIVRPPGLEPGTDRV